MVDAQVFVKNTFLDLDDGLRAPDLQRWRSTPCPQRAGLEDSSDEEDEPEQAPEAAGAEPPEMPDLYRTKTVDGYEPTEQWKWLGGDPNNLDFGGDFGLGGDFSGDLPGGELPPCPPLGEPGVPPPPPQSAPEVVAPGPGSAGVGLPEAQLPPPVPAGTAPGPPPPGPPVPAAAPVMGAHIGVVMIPQDAIQGGAMPFGAMGAVLGPPPFMLPGMPPDLVAVPVQRFTRWPDAMPPAGVPAIPGDGQLPPTPAPTPMPPVSDSNPEETPTPAPAASSSSAAPEVVEDGAEPDDSPPASVGPAPPRAPVLQRSSSVTNANLDRIRWTVDARKLKSTDREAVSPMFELSFSKTVNFKILIRPKVISSVRGGASFKKAKGKGSVELRCLDEVTAAMNPIVAFRISVGSGNDAARQEPPRGPVKHDFTKKAICGLPPGQEEWDFSKAVDEATQTFVVCLEVLAGTAAP